MSIPRAASLQQKFLIRRTDVPVRAASVQQKFLVRPATTTQGGYATDVLRHKPVAYYRLNEVGGTIRTSLAKIDGWPASQGAQYALRVEGAVEVGDALVAWNPESGESRPRSLHFLSEGERLVWASRIMLQGRPSTLPYLPPRAPAYVPGRPFGVAAEFAIKPAQMRPAPDPETGVVDPTKYATLIAAGVAPDRPDFRVQLEAQSDTSAQIAVFWRDSVWRSSRALEPNRSYHVVVAIDSVRPYLWIDGAEVTASGTVVQGTALADHPRFEYLVVGGEPGDQSSNYVGEISEVALYDFMPTQMAQSHYRSALMAGMAIEKNVASPTLVHLGRPIGTAVEKNLALPIGLPIPSGQQQIGLTTLEKRRLLAESLTDVEMSLVTVHRGEERDAPGLTNVVLATAPLGFWWLGEDGPQHLDSSGNERHFTRGTTAVPGPSIVPSEPSHPSTKFGGAVSDHGFQPTAPWMEAMEHVSTMAVVVPRIEHTGALIARADYTASYGPKYVFTLVYNDDNSFSLTIYGHTGDASTQASAKSPEDSAPADGSLYRVFGTYDGITIRLYVNGVEMATTPFVNTVRRPGTAGLSVGRTEYTGNSRLDGLMSAVGLWDRALTSQEIGDIDAEVVGLDVETDPLGHEHQPVTFVEQDGKFSNSNTVYFEHLEPALLLGWQLWGKLLGGRQRRWYGYWTSQDATWSNDVLKAPNHGLAEGDPIVFQTGRAPTGLGENTPYYVRDLSVSTFRVSATAGGAAIAIGGTGLCKFGRVFEVPAGESLEIPPGSLTAAF